MRKEVSGFIDKFEDLQRGSNVLSSNWLVKADLIEESQYSSSGDDSHMTYWCCGGTSLFLNLLGYPGITSDNFGLHIYIYHFVSYPWCLQGLLDCLYFSLSPF